ncbi:unnamed protein product [Ilex paraguariensis]|uniref:RRM domain-containing protein n=1 Tax=Ilex paraguariensis TaxID=185542 RepID=A0ABC8R5X5_9AQUA
MAAISSLFSPNLLHYPTIQQSPLSKPSFQILKPQIQLKLRFSPLFTNPKEQRRLSAVAEETLVSTQDQAAARRLYVGNIPRNVNNDELRRIVEEHGEVEKAEVT